MATKPEVHPIATNVHDVKWYMFLRTRLMERRQSRGASDRLELTMGSIWRILDSEMADALDTGGRDYNGH